ncbi:hypothetical protein B566_EDAN004790 [Ephemera danica]|nr:hypothetical protein B566_EDAN004790 [Ephemera danica]
MDESLRSCRDLPHSSKLLLKVLGNSDEALRGVLLRQGLRDHVLYCTRWRAGSVIASTRACPCDTAATATYNFALPLFYEMFPQNFVDSEVIKK